MSKPPYITKGSHVRAYWFQAQPIGTTALTGMMMKTTGMFRDVSGICRHFRGDDPVTPTKITVFVDPDPDTWDGPWVRPPGCTCPHPHVAVNPDHIVAVD